MDLSAQCPCAVVLADPRTSGDGPIGRGLWANSLARPPHERGWTLCASALDMIHIQTPARAGMDRYILLGLLRHCTDPRTSGDGPAL